MICHFAQPDSIPFLISLGQLRSSEEVLYMHFLISLGCEMINPIQAVQDHVHMLDISLLRRPSGCGSLMLS